MNLFLGFLEVVGLFIALAFVVYLISRLIFSAFFRTKNQYRNGDSYHSQYPTELRKDPSAEEEKDQW